MEFINLKAQYKTIENEINQSIKKVLEHGRFIMGPEVSELETALSEYVGVKHSIGVASGTDALLMALMALDIGPGDEVITTGFSFFATAEVISLLGATPRFIDIEPDTYNLDPALLESAITKKTKAIMPVSMYGQVADFDAINKIANEYNIPVIEDGAQSFGGTYKGRQSCNVSAIATTSFFPSKPLGCYGDGGAIFTNDDDIASRLRSIRVHGQTKRYYHSMIGINGRLDTIQAAVLIQKLAIFENELAKRQTVAKAYAKALVGVRRQEIKSHNVSAYAQFTIEVDKRADVIAFLKDAGIPTAVHYPIPIYKQPAYASHYESLHLPYTEDAANKVLSLPMHPYLTEDDINKISAKVLEAVEVFALA